MGNLKGVGVHISNYKSFGPDGGGFDDTKPINIVIGRNNSGKSALLDALELCGEWKRVPPELHFSGGEAALQFSKSVTADELKQVFREGNGGGDIRGDHWRDAGKYMIGSRVTVEMSNKGGQKLISIAPDITSRQPDIDKYYRQLAAFVINPFAGKSFVRLAADRDIIREGHSATFILPNKSGAGYTSTMSFLLHNIDQPSKRIKKILLEKINLIFAPDTSFTDIDTRKHNDNTWEIELEENGNDFISLSNSGSGLKTVLLVVGLTVLLPLHFGKPLSEFIFLFEELENNLHPALQRRLLNFVRNLAVEQGATAFITTHSSAVIDLFSHDEQAQILHVTHVDGVSRVRRPITYVEHHGILDDLDVRASDLLQANGIVWVEGPSDRLYFNRWVELWSGDTLREGTHYQCVFYGGRLLAHLSADDPDIDADDVVKVLNVNRNAMVVIDSDKRTAEQPINDTKQRIKAEIERSGGLAWVSDCKEIENYLPFAALKARYPGLVKPLKQFEDMYEYLDKNVEKGEGDRFKRQKVLCAEKFIPYLTRENLMGQWDFQAVMDKAVRQILRWNGLIPQV